MTAVIVVITPSFMRMRRISLAGHAGRFGQLADRAGQLNGDALFARRGGAATPTADAALSAAQRAMRPSLRVSTCRGVAAARELPLLAAAEHRAIFGFAVRLRPCRGDACLCRGDPLPRRPEPAAAGRADPSGRGFAASFLLRACARGGADERPAVCCLACRRRECRPATAGRAFARAARSAAGCSIGRDVLGSGASFTAGRARSAVPDRRLFLRSAGFGFAPTTGTLPVALPGTDVLLAAHRAGQRAGRRDVSTATACGFRGRRSRGKRALDWRGRFFGRLVGRLGSRGRRGRLRRDDDRHLARARGLGGPLRRRRRGFGRLGFAVPPPLRNCCDLFDFFLGQAGQRRPFARDAGLRANVDQFLAVKFQLFR